jgi:hypothetical protein
MHRRVPARYGHVRQASEARPRGHLVPLQVPRSSPAQYHGHSFETVSEYYNEILLCSQDIKDLGGECSDMQFKFHLIAGLDFEYKELVRPYIDERGVHIIPKNSSFTANDLFLRFLSCEAIRLVPNIG